MFVSRKYLQDQISQFFSEIRHLTTMSMNLKFESGLMQGFMQGQINSDKETIKRKDAEIALLRAQLRSYQEAEIKTGAIRQSMDEAEIEEEEPEEEKESFTEMLERLNQNIKTTFKNLANYFNNTTKKNTDETEDAGEYGTTGED